MSALQIKTKIVSCHTADSKPVKHEVNGTVILPPSVFPALINMRTMPTKAGNGTPVPGVVISYPLNQQSTYWYCHIHL